MIERVKTRMPSTTNSLESSHGHLNSKIPRRNDFWTSLNRLTSSLTKSDFHFKDRVKQVYNNTRRSVNKKVARLSNERMQYECSCYKTTVDKCLCGETIFESTLLKINIPCSHRVSKGATFPELPDFNLIMNPSINEFKLTTNIIPRERRAQSYDEIKILKENAVKTIKKYSHSKDKASITQYVDENLSTIGESFANGKPMNYHSVVHNGIIRYTKMLKTKEKIDNFEPLSLSTESE